MALSSVVEVPSAIVPDEVAVDEAAPVRRHRARGGAVREN